MANPEKTDLFSSILEMEIKEDTLIPEDDKEWCIKIQENLKKALDNLNGWYSQFKAHGDTLGHDYQINWYDDGECVGFRRYCNDNTDICHDFQFEPFDAISEVAKRYKHACNAFHKRVIGHFNEKYNINVDSHIDENEFTIRNQKFPLWEDVVQKVIAHLGGRTFTDTAMDEMKEEFLKHVKRYRGGHDVSLKSKVITIQNAVWVSERCIGGHYIGYDSVKKLNTMLKYLILRADGEIAGDVGMKGFDPDHPDFKEWYETGSVNMESVRIYKNNRVDFKFRTASAAQSCYDKLGLEELEEIAA